MWESKMQYYIVFSLNWRPRYTSRIPEGVAANWSRQMWGTFDVEDPPGANPIA
jgi:hypothetical protein